MRALVTGAGPAGIGGAVCLRLARDAQARGVAARIAMSTTGRRDDLPKFADEVRALGAHVLVLSGDLCDPEVPRRLVSAAVEFCGGALDALVSNAGVARPQSIVDASLAEWDKQMNLNARATWLLAQAAHPALKAARGAIVATSSIAGLRPNPGFGFYSVSKAALRMLCKMLAQDWAADGIRVNLVSPGSTRSRLTKAIYENPDVVAARNAAIPLGRIATGDDVAGVVAFLLGPDAAYITGEDIVVDGGLLGAGLKHSFAYRAPR